MSAHEAHRRSPSPTKAQQHGSRSASPTKGPLHRMLQSITPSPSGSFGGGPKLYETLDQPRSNTSRSNSLQNDPTAHGDHLPSDTFSPEPTRPKSRAESTQAEEERSIAASPLQRNGTVNVYHSDVSSDAYHPGAASAVVPPSGSRGRTLSYTSGDAYAPWGAAPPQQHQQYPPQSSTFMHQHYDHRDPHYHHHPHQPEHSQPGPPLPLPAPPSQPLHRGHSLQEASQYRSYSPRPFESQPARTSSDSPTAYAGPHDPSYIPAAPESGWQADQGMPRYESQGPQRRYTYGGPPQGWQSEHQPPTLQQSYHHPPHPPHPPPLAGPSSWQTAAPQPPPPRSPSPLPPAPISPRSYVSQTPDPHGSQAYPPSAAPPAPWGSIPSAIPPQSPVSRTSGTVRRSLPQPPGTPPGVSRPPSIPSYVPGQTPPATPTRASAYAKGASLATPLSPALATPPAALPSTTAAVDRAEPNRAISATAEAAILPTGSSSASDPITVSPAPQVSSPINGAPLRRSDSILSAAEELMARGMPSRRGRGAFGRSGRSPLSFASAPATASESTGRQDDQPIAARLQDQSTRGPTERAENTTVPNEEGELSKVLDGMSLQTSDAVLNNDVAPAGFTPRADTFDNPFPPRRPSSRGLRDDIVNDREPKYSVEPAASSSPPLHGSQSRRTPASFSGAQQEVAATHPRSNQPSAHIPEQAAQPPQPASPHGLTRVESIRSAAAAIPKIYSPPPNAAPPVPTIALPDEDDVASAGGPTIAISAPEDDGGRGAGISVNSNSASGMPSFSFSGPDEEVAGGPTIHVLGAEDDDGGANAPMISLFGPDSYDSASVPSAAGMTPSISLSHTSGFTPAMPQRASATSSASLAEQAARAQSEAQYRNGAVASASFDHRQSASSVAGTTCGSCSKYIAGRVVQAINQSFHPACFACNHCKELLEHVAFYEHDGKAYCHFDYHELFSLRCFHCRTPIVDERFIQINDPELLSSSNAAAGQKGGKNGTVGGGSGGAAAGAGVRYYHDLHFFCANCGDPFIDPKVASSTSGSERGKIQVDEAGRVLSGGKAFVVWKGYPYCETCHHSVHKPSCKACRKPILYDVITALKGKWHPECFVCEGCKRPFEDERVFVDTQGRGYDEECYRIWLKGTL